MGNASKARNASRRHPDALSTARSRARVAGSQDTYAMRPGRPAAPGRVPGPFAWAAALAAGGAGSKAIARPANPPLGRAQEDHHGTVQAALVHDRRHTTPGHRRPRL